MARKRGNAQLVGLAGFVVAAMLPAAGLLFLVPVVVSIGRNPESRLYPRGRNVYAGWGVSLYLLGVALASQVAAVTSVHPL